jgi:hypothetical protein
MTTQHAQVAKLIRAELRKHGITANVRSRTASMMTAVDVTLYDALPATVEQVESFCATFVYGHFDGMQDLYEYSNRRDDIPQVKFLHVRNEISPGRLASAWEYAKGYFADATQSAEPNSFEDYRFRQLVLDGEAGGWLAQSKPRAIAA